MGIYCIVVGGDGGLGVGVEYGGGLTYERYAKVVFPVIATAMALAPSAPIWLL